MRRIFARLPEQIASSLISNYLATSKFQVNGKRRGILINPKAYERLEKIARSENISMSSTLLLSAINMLLSRIDFLEAEQGRIDRRADSAQNTVKNFINTYNKILVEKEEQIESYKKSLDYKVESYKKLLGYKEKLVKNNAMDKEDLKEKNKEIQDKCDRKLRAVIDTIIKKLKDLKLPDKHHAKITYVIEWCEDYVCRI